MSSPPLSALYDDEVLVSQSQQAKTISTQSPDSEERQPSSRLAGFYRLDIDERRHTLAEAGWISTPEMEALARRADFDECVADTMSENVVGVHQLPLSVGLNFRINGRDRLAPM